MLVWQCLTLHLSFSLPLISLCQCWLVQRVTVRKRKRGREGGRERGMEGEMEGGMEEDEGTLLHLTHHFPSSPLPSSPLPPSLTHSLTCSRNMRKKISNTCMHHWVSSELLPKNRRSSSIPLMWRFQIT